MSKIKLLQILEATVGGTRKHLTDLILNLDKTKFQVTLICSTLRDKTYREDIDKMVKSGGQVEIIQMYRKIHLLADFIALLKMYSLMRRERYDIVHAHSSKAGFLGRLAARLAHIPVIIYSPHAYAFQSYRFGMLKFFYKILERFVGLFTDLIVAISESEKGITIDNRIIDPGKIVVVENALNLDDFEFDVDIDIEREKLGIQPREKVVITVGDFRPQKGYPYFIKSCAEVVKTVPNSKFLLVGKGRMRDRLETLVQYLGLNKRFLFVENCQDVRVLYMISDLFVLSSLWEGLPYAVLEAMATGKPVVATDIGGVRDVVKDGITGYLVPPKDTARMAKTIVELLNNPDKAEGMGEKGRLEIEKRYQLRQRMRKIEALYENTFEAQE